METTRKNVPGLAGADAARIVERIKGDPDFARSFLFGTSSLPGKSIALLRSRIISQIRKSYHVEVAPYVFNTQLYEHLWSDGTWKVLDSYDYRSTFFQWLGIVASHCIMAYLEENGYIRVPRARTPGNTRLALKRMTPDYCRTVIDDMLQIGLMHDFLSAVYVERLEQQDIMERYGMDEQMYKLTLKASEKALKTALLNNIHPYEDVLVDKGARKITVSSDFLAMVGSTNAVDSVSAQLRDALGISPDEPGFEEKVIDFFYGFSDTMGWSDEDKYVWRSRYIRNMTPDDVAESLPGRSRAWVDTRFSRLNKAFRSAVHKWWESV